MSRDHVVPIGAHTSSGQQRTEDGQTGGVTRKPTASRREPKEEIEGGAKTRPGASDEGTQRGSPRADCFRRL